MVRETADGNVWIPDHHGEATDRQPDTLSPTARFVLASLRQWGGSRSLTRLAHDVVTYRYGSTPLPERVQRAYLGLYHVQLRQLIAAGLVEYSEQDGTVSIA